MRGSLESKILSFQAILDKVVSETAVLAACLIDAKEDSQELLMWSGAEPPSKDRLATTVAEWINGKNTQGILGDFSASKGNSKRIKQITIEAGDDLVSMNHVIRPLHDPQSPAQRRFILAFAIPGDVSAGMLRIQIEAAETSIRRELSPERR